MLSLSFYWPNIKEILPYELGLDTWRILKYIHVVRFLQENK